MTRFESPDEQRLHELLDQTMSTVEPDDRLDQIFARTKVTSMSARRPWLWGAGGAAVATAAVITAVALVGNPLQKAEDLPPGGSNSPNPTQVTEPTQNTSAPAPTGKALPVYFVGDTPHGPRLYREFQTNVGDTEPVSTAVTLAIHGTPNDPDYRTLWPAGSDLTSAGIAQDLITIGLIGNLHDRPAGMTKAEAELAIQQVIYTAQAAYGHGRVPVQFLLNDSHTDQILGEPASEPLAEGDWSSTLALVNITDPIEGTHVPYGATLHVTGVASSFEATVPWTLKRGDEPIDGGSFMAEGWMEHLYPFSGDIELGQLSRGTYTLVCSTDDPSGGAEGNGPMSDTRTIVIE